MTESVVDITQYKFDQAEKELRGKLVDYSERPEMQSQIGEAFYIWKNDPEFTSEDISEAEIDELTFEKFLDWFLYDFKLLDSEKTSGYKVVAFFATLYLVFPKRYERPNTCPISVITGYSYQQILSIKSKLELSTG